MHPAGRKDDPSLRELEGRIKDYLLSALQTLASLNVDISLYLYHHDHTTQNAHRDPLGGNGLDEAYNLYEQQANDCRRWWMRLRTASEKRAKTINDLPPSSSRLDTESPSSPLEYQSALDEDEVFEGRRNGQITPVDVDAARHIPRPQTPIADQRPLKPKSEKVDAPVPRGVMVTPSGPTSCRLAPIPKGVKLSVETTRIPTPRKPPAFQMPRQPIVNESERRPLNRTKQNRRESQPSKNGSVSQTSLQSSNQRAGPSTARTSVSASPREDYSSASEYWIPRRGNRPGDFQMDESRLFSSLDCLGPPFEVKMAEITHRDIRATQADLRAIYGGKLSLTPKIVAEKLANHGFDHWMTPNMDFHPFLPARPGWPGLMLRSDDELEEWSPGDGSAFRVVVRREPHFIEYLGQYEMVRLGDITGDEWNRQPPKVKKRWTQVLGGGQSSNDAIVRVALRKRLGKEPSVEDLKKFADGFSPDLGLAKELNDDADRALCRGEEVIAVWGMKCVGYDFKFEKHLARSLRAFKPKPSTTPGTAKKRKTFARVGAMDDAEDAGEGEQSGSEDSSSPSKRQRVAKGKAKLVKYDWSDARFQGESEDEDYKPT